MSEINTGNVARYCKPTTLDENKKPTSAAFQKRVNEKYLSVYLLEFYQQRTEQGKIYEIKRYMQARNFTLKPNGLFAVINIEDYKKYIFE